MHYSYLKLWNSETVITSQSFKEIVKFEDQYLISFKSNHCPIQINLSSKDSFIFITDRYSELEFDNSGDLNLLNTQLQHSKLMKITLDENDRIYALHFEKYNIYNIIEELILFLELSPRNQNIILCRVKDNKNMIIDCLRKISFSENNTRQVLPGLEYKQAETSYVTIPLDINYPLYITNDKVSDIKTDNSLEFNNMNCLLESLYYDSFLTAKMLEHRKQIITNIKQKIKKKSKKLENLKSDLYSEEESVIFKKKGELLLASYNQISAGTEFIILEDYYLEDRPEIRIELNKALSLKQNVNLYFKKYKKAESGRIKVNQQIEGCKNEIKELEAEIEYVNEIGDLQMLKSYHKMEKENIKDDRKTFFRRLIINEAWEIFIGRSSKENDMLTCKVAQNNDWWFHTRIYQGTHVVLRNYKKLIPSDEMIAFCCRLAAYYSRAKTSINVPVDYTQIKYVRKPRGSVAGYVTYTNQKTLFVTPLSIREAGEIIRKGELK